MITGPECFFSSSDRVHVVKYHGRPQLASTAPRGADRYRDAAVLPASRMSAAAYKTMVRLWCAAGFVPPLRGAADTEMLDLIERVLALSDYGERVVARMGTAGAAMKATLLIVDSDGNDVAFAKIAWTEYARQLVHNEAAVLSVVTDVVVPRVLGMLDTLSYSCLLVSPLSGRALDGASTVPEEVMRRARHAQTVPIREHPYVARLMSRYSTIVEQVASKAGLVGLPVGVTHGDATPWNCRLMPDGSIGIFDWEYGCSEGMPLADVAHWVLQVSHLIVRCTPERAIDRAIVELSRRVGLSSRQAAGVCTLTALEMSDRLGFEGEQGQSNWWRGCAEAGIRSMNGSGA